MKPRPFSASNLCKQPLSPNLHVAEGEPFLAQILQRGPDMIDGVVDAEETVVGVVVLEANLHKSIINGSLRSSR